MAYQLDRIVYKKAGRWEKLIGGFLCNNWSTDGFKGDNKLGTSKRTNQAKLAAFEPENKFLQGIPDRLRRCHTPIEEKIERDWSNLRAVGSDYDDFVHHLLELFMTVEESGEANSPSKPKSKIVATRLHERGTNVLKLKLLIE